MGDSTSSSRLIDGTAGGDLTFLVNDWSRPSTRRGFRPGAFRDGRYRNASNFEGEFEVHRRLDARSVLGLGNSRTSARGIAAAPCAHSRLVRWLTSPVQHLALHARAGTVDKLAALRVHHTATAGAVRRNAECCHPSFRKRERRRTSSRSGVFGLISSRGGSVVRVIVSVPVRLPPARALAGEVRSQDSARAGWVAMAAAVNKRQGLGRFLGSDFLHVFRPAWPNDLNRPPPLTVRPNELVLGSAFRRASRLFRRGYRDPLLFASHLVTRISCSVLVKTCLKLSRLTT